MENGHPDTSEGNSESTEMDPYEKKYLALLRRCETVQQNNERLVNRLNHIKKLLRRLRHERRFLKRRLDKHEDDYRNMPLMLSMDSMEEEPNLSLATAPIFPSCLQTVPPPPSLSATPPRQSTVTTSILSSTLLSRGSPHTVPTPKAGSSSSLVGSTSKKGSRDKNEPENVQTQPSNPFFMFPSDQSTPIMDGYVQPSKVSYNVYNGEKDLWLYEANEDLNHPLTLDKNSLLLRDNTSSLS